MLRRLAAIHTTASPNCSPHGFPRVVICWNYFFPFQVSIKTRFSHWGPEGRSSRHFGVGKLNLDITSRPNPRPRCPPGFKLVFASRHQLNLSVADVPPARFRAAPGGRSDQEQNLVPSESDRVHRLQQPRVTSHRPQGGGSCSGTRKPCFRPGAGGKT